MRPTTRKRFETIINSNKLNTETKSKTSTTSTTSSSSTNTTTATSTNNTTNLTNATTITTNATNATTTHHHNYTSKIKPNKNDVITGRKMIYTAATTQDDMEDDDDNNDIFGYIDTKPTSRSKKEEEEDGDESDYDDRDNDNDQDYSRGIIKGDAESRSTIEDDFNPEIAELRSKISRMQSCQHRQMIVVVKGK